MSISSRTLKHSELQNLDKAKEMANQLEYQPWIQWMRNNFSYSASVRMCTFVGIKMPSHGFYLKIKNYSKEAA